MIRLLRLATLPRLAGLVVIAMLLDGCSGAQVTSTAPPTSSPTGTPKPPSPTPTPSPTPSPTGITIQGTPATSVTAGSPYSFQPTVSASTAVTYSILGQPVWASFSTATGALTGTPTAAQVGTTASITITASDGSSSASLSPFTIQVKAAGGNPPPTTGAATLSWSAPTQNTDGSPVTGLAGYHIYYGLDQSNPNHTITLSGAATTSYVVEGLPPGTYYFTVVAYNWAGINSTDSNVAVKTI